MLMLGILLGAPSYADDADKKLLLEVVINGRTTGQIADFVARGNELLASRKDLAELGLAVPGHGADDAMVALSQLRDVTYQVDAPTQTLRVKAPDSALIARALAAEDTTSLAPVRSGLGAVLNYDVNETHAGGQDVVRGVADARAFTPYGVLESQYLAAAGAISSTVRLDSSYSYSDPDTLRRYRAGDVINGGLSWTRPIRIGGVQVDTNFAARPDLVTFPVPQISGTAAVPSTVDVLVNNVRQLSRSVDPGPFAVTQLPVVTGAGTISVVVQDALGQQTTQNLSFYTTTSMLAPGLLSYSGEVGAVRRNYGLASNDYSTPVASATARYGLFRFLTLEGHAEGTDSLGMGGGGVAVNLGNLAVLGLDGGGSSFGRNTGALYTASIERVTPRLSISASIQRTTKGYRDVASANGDPVPRQLLRGAIGLSLGRFGGLNIAYTGLDQKAPAIQNNALLNPVGSPFSTGVIAPLAGEATHTQLISLTYTAQVIGNVYGYATGYHDFAHGNSTGFVFGISMPLGPKRSVAANVGSTDHHLYALEQATQAAVDVGDWGGSVLNQNGAPNRQSGEADYIAPFARLSAGADRGRPPDRGARRRIGRAGARRRACLRDQHRAGQLRRRRHRRPANIGVLQENRAGRSHRPVRPPAAAEPAILRRKPHRRRSGERAARHRSAVLHAGDSPAGQVGRGGQVSDEQQRERDPAPGGRGRRRPAARQRGKDRRRRRRQRGRL